MTATNLDPIPDDTATALDALRGVYDPELGIDIVALGLVYAVRSSDDGGVDVDMTLTTPGCPVSEQLPSEAAAAVREALPGHPVHVRVVWDPPWTPDRIEVPSGHALGRPRRRR